MKVSITDLTNKTTIKLQNKTDAEKPIKKRKQNNSKRSKKRK
jgi:hypothetical protein